MNELRPPPKSLRVEVFPDAYELVVERMPEPATLLSIALCVIVLIGLLGAPVWVFQSLRSGPDLIPPLVDSGHMRWHVCEGHSFDEMSDELYEHCARHAPWKVTQAWVNLQTVDVALEGGPIDQAREDARQEAIDSWADKHADAVRIFHTEHRHWKEGLGRRIPEHLHRRSRANLLVAGLGAVFLGLLALLVLLVRRLRSLTLRVTPDRVQWGAQSVAAGEIARCHRDEDGLILQLHDGSTQSTGPTAHDADALDWIAEAISQTATTRREHDEMIALGEQLRSRHAALAGRVRG